MIGDTTPRDGGTAPDGGPPPEHRSTAPEHRTTAPETRTSREGGAAFGGGMSREGGPAPEGRTSHDGGGADVDWTSAERWVALAGGSAASLAVRAELLARWSEPHRHYHTRTHLAAVLAGIAPLAAEADDPAAVRLAAWFHDAIYDGRPGRDEERSAQLAQSRLPRCGVPAGRVAETARLVRLTAAHDTLAPGDRDGAVLCDADLAVLGSPGYADYARAIRREYAHIPDELFAQGRTQVLRRLLATPSLYRTARARELWEAKARANMTGELTRLRALAAAQPGRDETP